MPIIINPAPPPGDQVLDPNVRPVWVNIGPCCCVGPSLCPVCTVTPLVMKAKFNGVTTKTPQCPPGVCEAYYANDLLMTWQGIYTHNSNAQQFCHWRHVINGLCADDELFSGEVYDLFLPLNQTFGIKMKFRRGPLNAQLVDPFVCPPSGGFDLDYILTTTPNCLGPNLLNLCENFGATYGCQGFPLSVTVQPQ